MSARCSRPKLTAKPAVRPFFRARRGNVIVIVAGGMTALVGMGSMVVDVGIAMAQRTKMQMAADAAALAGARYVRQNPDMVPTEAVYVAGLNGFTLQPSDVSVDSFNYQVTVAWKQDTGFVLAPIFNLLGVKVGVSSTAESVSNKANNHLLPFLVPVGSVQIGQPTILKYGSGGNGMATGRGGGLPGVVTGQVRGNFGAAALDGPGAQLYQRAIEVGARGIVQVGQFVDTQPGNMVGPTDCGVQTLIAGDSSTYDQALTSGSKRVGTVLLVDDTDFASLQGRKPILVRGFARFYVEDSTHGEVTGRFIDEKFGSDPSAEQFHPKLVR